MDGRRFDELTKTLAVGISRRNLVRGAIGSSFAAVMAALGRETAQAKPKPKTCKVGCAGLPGKQEKACEKACKACGGDFNRVCTKDGPFGPTDITCCPTGTFCVFGAGVCCDEGTEPCFGPTGDATCCAAGTFCNFATGQCEPPANCGPESGCLGGACAAGCFCVSSVEGDGACVNGEFAQCTAPPCDTSADCGPGGTCVDVTSDMCCGGAPSARVCFPPEAICQTDGVGRAANTTPGWHR